MINNKFFFSIILICLFICCENKQENKFHHYYLSGENEFDDFLILKIKNDSAVLDNIKTNQSYKLFRRKEDFSLIIDSLNGFKVKKEDNKFVLVDDNHFFKGLSKNEFINLPFDSENNDARRKMQEKYWYLKSNYTEIQDSTFYFFEDNIAEVYTKKANSKEEYLASIQLNYFQSKNYESIYFPLPIAEYPSFVVGASTSKIELYTYNFKNSEFIKIELQKYASINQINQLKGKWRTNDESSTHFFPEEIEFLNEKALIGKYELNYKLGLNSRFLQIEFIENKNALLFSQGLIDIIDLTQERLILSVNNRFGDFETTYHKQ